MTRVPALFALAVLVVAAAGCDKTLARDALARARTPAEEAAAMEKVWRACQPLSLSVEDRTGASLPVSAPSFPKDAHRVHIGGPCSIDHQLIEPKNVLILMRE